MIAGTGKFERLLNFECKICFPKWWPLVAEILHVCLHIRNLTKKLPRCQVLRSRLEHLAQKSKEKIQKAEQHKTAPTVPENINEWQYYKNVLAEYTNYKDGENIIGQLLKMAHSAGYKNKEEK